MIAVAIITFNIITFAVCAEFNILDLAPMAIGMFAAAVGIAPAVHLLIVAAAIIGYNCESIEDHSTTPYRDLARSLAGVCAVLGATGSTVYAGYLALAR